MLIEQEAQRRKEARGRFIDGVWANKHSDELLSLLAEAGLTVSVADELLNKVEQARERIKHVNQLPRLRKVAAEAGSHLDTVHAHAQAETARLEAEVEEASAAASDARKAMYAAEDSSRQLLAQYDEGLLPASKLPKELAHLLRRRQAEEAAYKAGQVRTAASNEVDRCKVVVFRLENQLASMPLSPTSQQDESRLQRALKMANDELYRAKARLKAADTAAEAARKAIP